MDDFVFKKKKKNQSIPQSEASPDWMKKKKLVAIYLNGFR